MGLSPGPAAWLGLVSPFLEHSIFSSKALILHHYRQALGFHPCSSHLCLQAVLQVKLPCTQHHASFQYRGEYRRPCIVRPVLCCRSDGFPSARQEAQAGAHAGCRGQGGPAPCGAAARNAQAGWAASPQGAHPGRGQRPSHHGELHCCALPTGVLIILLRSS